MRHHKAWLCLLAVGCAEASPPIVQTAAPAVEIAPSGAYTAYVHEATAKPDFSAPALRRKLATLRSDLSDAAAVDWRRDLVRRLSVEAKRAPHAEPGRIYAAALSDLHRDATALHATSAAYTGFARGRPVAPAPLAPLPDSLNWTQYAAAPRQPSSLPERLLASAVSGKDDPAGDAALKTCVQRARLNIDQCAAAAHDAHEVAYCISAHGINEPTDSCFAWLLP